MARRRLLLVAAGGVAIGVATVTGRGGGSHLAASTQDEAPHTGPTRQPAKAKSNTKPARSAGHAPARTPDTTDGRPVYYVDDGPDVIALTIDDGPSPVYTPQVLSILEKYDIKAAFSMVGENVTYYPSIAREVADAGHTIVNHTWNHANLMSMKRSKLPGEVDRAADAIHSATGQRPGMFRAPYGAWSPILLDYCESEKLTPLDWSVDPQDWARPGVSKIVKTIMGTTKTGSIILEHDGGGDRSETVAALKIVIPRLIDEGYTFTVP
jgi:peptidoglycan/xylan/chitin deacetylase (PgdA/CDA1 family)